MLVKVLQPVTFRGKAVEPGAVLDLSELSAKALIAEGRAALDASISPTAGEETREGNDTPESQEVAEQARIGFLVKGLETQYKRDDLAKAAQAVGVEFPFNATKAKIIQTVIDQGKAETLLK